MAHATTDRGPITETPLTREAMAELLELHRAGLQADLENITVEQQRWMDTKTDRDQEWVRAFAKSCAEKIVPSVADQVAARMVAALRSDKKIRRSIERAVQWGVFKGIIAVILLGVLIDIGLRIMGVRPTPLEFIFTFRR